jgi:hypothetical protein
VARFSQRDSVERSGASSVGHRSRIAFWVSLSVAPARMCCIRVGQQGGQGVEHHQVQRFLAMQSLQTGDQGGPLGISWTSAPVGATEELDVVLQGELTTAGVPVGRGFLGDHQGSAGGNRIAIRVSGKHHRVQALVRREARR